MGTDIRQAPGTRSEYTGTSVSELGGKDTRILPRLQRKVIEMLRDGGRYSAADISARLHLSDPRGHISALRRKGFAVLDEWVTSEYGTRYKVYFVGKGGVI